MILVWVSLLIGALLVGIHYVVPMSLIMHIVLAAITVLLITPLIGFALVTDKVTRGYRVRVTKDKIRTDV